VNPLFHEIKPAGLNVTFGGNITDKEVQRENGLTDLLLNHYKFAGGLNLDKNEPL
jgi:hypothetical protein